MSGGIPPQMLEEFSIESRRNPKKIYGRVSETKKNLEKSLEAILRKSLDATKPFGIVLKEIPAKIPGE